MLCQQSALQALLTCTMPRELHEDIQELGESPITVFPLSPCSNLHIMSVLLPCLTVF